MRCPVLARTALLVLLAAAPPVHAGLSLEGVETLDGCDALVRDHPEELEAYRCYLKVARRHRVGDDALRRLDALMAIEPENYRVTLYLASLEEDRGGERAEALYRRAGSGAEAAGDRSAATYARLSLFDLLSRQGRLDEADVELALAREQAEASGDSLLRLLVRNNEGWRAYGRLDYAAAFLIFREIEEAIFPEGPAWMQGRVLAGLGAASWGVGRNRTALDYYRREAEVRRRAGDVFAEAQAISNAATVAGFLRREGEVVEDIGGLFRSALETAVGTGNLRAEALARTLMTSVSDVPGALKHLERAELLRRRMGHLRDLPEIYRSRATLLVKLEPPDVDGALDLLGRSARLAREVGDLRTQAIALLDAANLHLSLGRRDAFVSTSRDALDVMMSIRDRQSEDIARARYFGRWAERFAWVAVQIGVGAGSPTREEHALALDIAERMRSRVLLERLDMARVTETLAPDSPAASRRRGILEELTRAQRALMRAELSDDRRAELVAKLEALEDAESRLRLEIARENPDYAAVRDPVVTTLAELQESLGEDQVLLSFLCVDARSGPELPAGGSRLFVYSRGAVRSYPLPGRREIEDRVALLQGLFQRRDGSVEVGAMRLYQDLVAEALDDLPPGVRRLVIVPDGSLHRLPFGVLRASVDEPMLAERFEITLAPSVTTWHRWRTGRATSAERAVIGFVDPEPPGAAGGPAEERAWAPEAGIRLGPLPHARTEARALGRLGPGDVFMGREASERALKTGKLNSYGVLHFAAHALVDNERPARSAVLLTPGDPGEDGLMQFREIVDLDLAGQVVVLSACRSAAGALQAGEGVMGLAHAFFQAGARTVVGGLWPLRDDETAALVTAFYRHLGKGSSVAAALTAARVDRIAAGAPPAAWAGLVVLGDGDHVPFPGGRHASLAPPWALGLAVVLVAALVGVAAARRRAG